MGRLIVLGPTVGPEAFVIVGLCLLVLGTGASFALALLLTLVVPRTLKRRFSYVPLGSLVVSVVMAAPFLVPALVARNGPWALVGIVSGVFGYFPAVFALDAAHRLEIAKAERRARPAPRTP